MIPDWWLTISAVFFVLSVVLIVALIYVLYKVLQVFKRIEPQIIDLTTKVDSIAGQVNEISASLKETVTVVGGKTRGIATAADMIAGTLAGNMGKIGPIITAIMTALKLFNAVKDARGPKQKSLPGKGD